MEDNNIFMICRDLNKNAFQSLDQHLTVRNLRKSEIELWKTIHFDTEYDKQTYYYLIDDYYTQFLGSKKGEFLNQCKVICDANNQILGTCFLWKTTSKLWSIQWFKVIETYANRGIGRQLLSSVFSEADSNIFPIILHTHPVSYSAIKLYSDFGFPFLTNTKIGLRGNHLHESLSFIKNKMTYNQFKFTYLTEYEVQMLNGYEIEDF